MLIVDGRTLLSRTLETLRGLTDQVVIVGDRPEYHGHGAPVIDDDGPRSGPLSGIVAALRWLDCERVVVVACDMPCLSVALLQDMATFPGDWDAIVPRTGSGERAQDHPLHAVYSSACLPRFTDCLAHGRLRVTTALEPLRVAYLDEHWLHARDPSLASLTNVNTTEELDALLRDANAASVEEETR